MQKDDVTDVTSVAGVTEANLLWPGKILKLGLIESRPIVQVMFVSRFLAAALLGGGTIHHAGAIAAGAIAWFAAAVAVPSRQAS
jgi:hypothetical protein